MPGPEPGRLDGFRDLDAAAMPGSAAGPDLDLRRRRRRFRGEGSSASSAWHA